MVVLTIKSKCEQCHGTGTYYPHGQEGVGEGIPCPWPGCNGTGTIDSGDVELEANHFFTHEILECIVLAELVALTDNQKTLLGVIIGATIVDLSPGSNVRGWLMDMFPNGTDTYDNLTELVNG